MNKRILITGSSGFIGSFLCDEALHRGYETYAAVRGGSSRRWLQHKDLNFITLDFNDSAQMADAFRHEGVKFDVVVHAGGATKCLDKDEFMRHNYQSTVNLVEALVAAGSVPATFVYLSSLSAIYGSAYGESKLKTEGWLKAHPLFAGKADGSACRLFIFRPTGVYGPREKDYFMMAKSIKQHIDFAVGYKRQVLTFVYVRDLVSAIFAAIGKNEVANGKTYLVSDGHNYDSRAFSDLIQKELGVKGVLHIKAPLWLLRVISGVAEWFSHLTGKPSTLNGDKYRIMRQRNWQCDISPIRRDLGFEPEWPLERGVKECMQWYKDNKWL